MSGHDLESKQFKKGPNESLKGLSFPSTHLTTPTSFRDFSLPSDVTTRIAQRYLGCSAKTIKEYFGGFSRVLLAEGDAGKLIFKFSQGSDTYAGYQGLRKECWCLQTAREHDLPVPAVILETARLSEIYGEKYDSISFYVQEARPGVLASTVTTLQGREKIWRQLGEYTARLNAIKTSAWGTHINAAGSNWTGLSWGARVAKAARNLDHPALWKYEAYCFTRDRELLGNIFYNLSHSKFTPCLAHLDLHLNQALVDQDGKVTTILDFGQAQPEPAPYAELATILERYPQPERQSFYPQTVGENGAFLKGYGMDPEEYDRRALHRFKLFRAISLADLFLDQGNGNTLHFLRSFRAYLDVMRSLGKG